MIVTLADGQKFNAESTQEILSQDKDSFILSIYSRDNTKTIEQLVAMLTTENIASITITSNDGKISDTYTKYVQFIGIYKRTNDYESNFDIRLADAKYTTPSGL